MSTLDNLPVASIVFVAGLLVSIFAYLTGDITIEQFYEFLALNGVGSGAIGYARSHSGKGTL